MINGHKVLAPRYDSVGNCSKGDFCVFDSSEKDGVLVIELGEGNTSYRLQFGWFDFYDDCEAYANAHRENK